MKQDTTPTIRQRKVGRIIRESGPIYRRKDNPVPSLTLAGKWLAAAGFDIDAQTEIEVHQGKLVVRLRK